MEFSIGRWLVASNYGCGDTPFKCPETKSSFIRQTNTIFQLQAG